MSLVAGYLSRNSPDFGATKALGADWSFSISVGTSMAGSDDLDCFLGSFNTIQVDFLHFSSVVVQNHNCFV